MTAIDALLGGTGAAVVAYAWAESTGPTAPCHRAASTGAGATRANAAGPPTASAPSTRATRDNDSTPGAADCPGAGAAGANARSAHCASAARTNIAAGCAGAAGWDAAGSRRTIWISGTNGRLPIETACVEHSRPRAARHEADEKRHPQERPHEMS